MSNRLFFDGKQKIKFSRPVTHRGLYFEYRRRKMSFITQGGGGGGEKVNTLSLLQKEEEELNTNSLAIENVAGTMQLNLRQLKIYAVGNTDVLSLIAQMEEGNAEVQKLAKEQLIIALDTVENAKELQNELGMVRAECDMASVTGEQLAIVSGEKELLVDQLNTTQLLLQNEQAAKEQIQIQVNAVNTQLNETLAIVGTADSPDQQVALLAQAVKTKETEKARLASTVQDLQGQLQIATNSILAKENTYANQLEQLRQAAIARENERVERENQFSQYQTETEQRLQMVIAENKAVEEREYNNVLQLTNVSQEIQQVKDECYQKSEEKEQQIVNLTQQYTAKIDDVNQNFQLVQNNNQFLANETERLRLLVMALENNNQAIVTGNDQILAIQLAESSKALDVLGEESAKLRTENSLLVATASRLQKEINTSQLIVTQTNEQASKTSAEKESLRRTNAELTSNVKLLTQEKQQLVNVQQELTKVSQQLSAEKSKATTLGLEKKRLEVADTQLRSEINLLKTKLKEEEGRIEVIKKENNQLTIIDPNAAKTAQAIVAAQQSLAVAQGKADLLQVQYDNALKKSQTMEKEVLALKTSLSQKDFQIQDCSLFSAKDKQIHDAINQVRLYRIDTTTGKVIEEKPQSFNPQTNLSHKSVLIFGPSEKRLIESSVPYEAKLRKMQLIEGTQFFTLLQRDPTWQGDYVVLKRNEWSELRKNYCRPCDKAGPIITNTTSTTSTTTTQTLIGLGSSAVALNHIEALNQLSWQESTRHLRSYPGDYQVEVKFSRGKPSLGYTEELRFVASNVHLVKDPNYASDDNYYVIDLTRPDTVNNLHYTSVGTLVLNGIHGHGSFAYRITNKTTDELAKSAIIEDYAVEEDATRPYNTKLVFSPGEDVVFYARDTGRDTYILETILIKQ